MDYSRIIKYLFYFSLGFLVFSIFLYSLPVLIIIGIIFFIIMGFLWFLNYIFGRINSKILESKYDENGARKTKATVVDIKPAKDKEDNQNGKI